MSDYRPIKTEIWRGNWFPTLSSEEKVVWIFLLTNELLHASGIYRIPKTLIGAFTGVPDAGRVIDKFEADGKVIYKEGYIFIVNYLENQAKQYSRLDNVTRSIVNLFKENPKVIELFSLRDREAYELFLSLFDDPLKPLHRPSSKEERVKGKEERGKRKVVDPSPSVEQNVQDGPPKTITAGTIGIKSWDDTKVRGLLADGWTPTLEGCPARFKGDREWESQTHDSRWLRYSGSLVQNLIWKK